MIETRLQLDHLDRLERLQGQLPEAFRTPINRLQESLLLLERTPPHLSWLLEDESGPAGYLMAYLAPSAIESEAKETVICIGDLVSAGKPNIFYRLLCLLKQSLEQHSLQHLAIEANCRAAMASMVTEHSKALARLGYEMVAEHSSWNESLEETLWWIRLHPLKDQTIATRDQVSWSAELQEPS